MRIIDVTRRAGRSLRQAKLRTFLTSLAIAVGAFTVTLALAAGAGMRNYTAKILNDQTNQNIVMVTMPQRDSNDNKPYEYNPNQAQSADATLKQSDIDRIANVPGVRSVTADYSLDPTYMQIDNGKKLVAPLYQQNPGKTYELVAGNVTKNQAIADDQIIITEELADAAGISPQDALGKTVHVHYESKVAVDNTGQPATQTTDYTVVAVTRASQSAMDPTYSQMISPGAAKTAATFQNGPADRFYSVNAMVSDPDNASNVKNAIDDLGYEAYTAEDMKGQVFQTVNIMQYAAAGFGALAILASVFGIVNTLYISVYERTRQIGLMKALGARRRDVSRLFKLEAAWIGLLGSAIGLGLAIITALALNPVIASTLKLGPGTTLLIIQPLTAVLLVIGLILVAVLAGILPARKAAKLDPIEALRTE